MKNYFKLIIMGLVVNIVTAQPSSSDFDKLVLESFNDKDPGAVILVSKKGKVIYEKAVGKANLEHNISLDKNSVFEIGSITKQFTSVAVLQLMEKGLLNLDDAVTKHLENLPQHFNKITIHHLLSHTSGLNNFTSEDSWVDLWRIDLSIDKTIEIFKNKPLEFKPGERFSYCNSGYILLGAIIEKVSGLTYENYLQKNIFNPLNMGNSYFGSRSKIINNRVSGYQHNGNFVNAEYVTFSQSHAAGALMSTTNDLLKWNLGLTQNKVISKESLKLASQNHKLNSGSLLNYGYGWFINELEGYKTIEHGGGIFGFITYALYVPEEDIYVVVLTNYDRYNPEVIAVKLAILALNKQNQVVKPIKLKPEVAKQWVGVYEFDDKLIRNIIFEKDTLYSQLSGGNKIPLVPISDNEFMFSGISNAKLKFQVVDKNINAQLINRIIIKNGIKTEKKKEIKSVTIDEAILRTYTGDYKIPPALTFKVFVKNLTLFVQFLGQPEIECDALSETHFFTKIGEAEINFVKNDNEQNFSIVLKQNGKSFNAIKL
ncbi:serine hydrolase [Flavobacterium sp.]|jgi:CubicO group peptidase (beta-lactamase class C family)|uniref:serine hydrolase n=1 Tax=Flavobacterium sp. TaxID=239 RepID=UPI0037BEB818